MIICTLVKQDTIGSIINTGKYIEYPLCKYIYRLIFAASQISQTRRKVLYTACILINYTKAMIYLHNI